LTDVVLSCGSRRFSAHKLVLSVSSGYFAQLFAHKQPGLFFGQTIVYLKDVDAKHMELILAYMYRGEVTVREGELMALLETAKGLKVKGMCETELTENEKEKTLLIHSSQKKSMMKRESNEKLAGAEARKDGESRLPDDFGRDAEDFEARDAAEAFPAKRARREEHPPPKLEDNVCPECGRELETAFDPPLYSDS